MTHLNEDERLVLIESDGEPAHPHLAACERCRVEVAEARGLLREVRGVDVPEPSPLFWDALSSRVSERTAAVVSGVPRGAGAFWRVLVPLAAAVGALVIAVGIGRGPRPGAAVAAPTAAAEPAGVTAGAEAEDAEWQLLASLAAEFDLDTLSDSLGRSEVGGAERAVWQLSERERAELAALLEDELRQRP